MKCFNEKNQHIGRLVEIDRTAVTYDDDAVTRWCPECGAVVVDHELDCRIIGQYAKMSFPEITRKARKRANKPEQGVYKDLWEEEWTIKK